jgi:hypothetical protein
MKKLRLGPSNILGLGLWVLLSKKSQAWRSGSGSGPTHLYNKEQEPIVQKLRN